MPIIGFKCPDGQTIRKEDCAKACRLGLRCATLPTLMAMTRFRDPDGPPSVTECLRGTMEAFLIRKKDYYIDPQGHVFALHGTRVHDMLDGQAKKIGSGMESELALSFGGITGITDLLTPVDGLENTFDMVDHKTWGSFMVAKALGIYTVDVPTGEVFKSGPRKGMEKTKKEVRQDNEHINMVDTEMQMNMYRIMSESCGSRIREMYVEAIVRDGGIAMASSRGVTRNIYMFPVRRLDDDDVYSYFHGKAEALVYALTEGVVSEPCADDECWSGKKCSGHCDVAEFCPRGRQAIEQVEKREEDSE